jgi:hypothetical protein
VGRYAQNTEVPVERSKAEIERTLSRYGADQFMYGWDAHAAVLGFRINGRMYRVDIPLPDKTERRFQAAKTNQYFDQGQFVQAAYDLAVRQRWRAAALYIKATLEAAESGITSLEVAFLAYTLLPTGETLGKWAEPQVQQAYLTGQMPKMLPGLPAPKKEGTE